MSIESDLESARERLRRAVLALGPRHKGGEIEEWHAASQRVLALERDLGRIRHLPHAETIPFAVPWDTGAPMPFVIASEHSVHVVFHARERDGSERASARLPSSSDSVGAVQFRGAVSHRFGSPNDEVLDGHPLSNWGLEPYAAQIVRNSPWLSEIQAINSVHPHYDADRWKTLNHYVLWFHDTTFECLASGFAVARQQGTRMEVIGRLVEHLSSGVDC